MKMFFFIFIISVLFIFSEIVFAQQGLLIQNKAKQMGWMYEVGAKVTYIKFGEEEYTRGELIALLDSSVVIGNDTVQLKDIAGVRKKSPLHNLARVVGIPVMLIGVVLIGEGVTSMYVHASVNPGYKIIMAGITLFAIGYLPYYFPKKDLEVNLGGDWIISIYRGAEFPSQ